MDLYHVVPLTRSLFFWRLARFNTISLPSVRRMPVTRPVPERDQMEIGSPVLPSADQDPMGNTGGPLGVVDIG